MKKEVNIDEQIKELKREALSINRFTGGFVKFKENKKKKIKFE